MKTQWKNKAKILTLLQPTKENNEGNYNGFEYDMEDETTEKLTSKLLKNKLEMKWMKTFQ